MNCPKCNKNTMVIETRWVPIRYMPSGYTRRRRQCRECGFRFETEEYYRHPIIKRSRWE